MFIANTWRTLAPNGRPQGCDHIVFLASATFPSHPKTHDCKANKGHAATLSKNHKAKPGRGIEKQLLRILQVGPGDIWSRSLQQLCRRVGDRAEPTQEGASINARASPRFPSDKERAGERARLPRAFLRCEHKAAFVRLLNLRPLLQRGGPDATWTPKPSATSGLSVWGVCSIPRLARIFGPRGLKPPPRLGLTPNLHSEGQSDKYSGESRIPEPRVCCLRSDIGMKAADGGSWGG